MEKGKMESVKCRCCDGTGVQVNKDGLRVICPCCLGSGWRDTPYK